MLIYCCPFLCQYIKVTDLSKNLTIFGLNLKEINVYTFLLSNKDLPAYKIATETRIPRTTVYKILEALEKQGLVSKWSKNNVKHFSAESPERLKILIKQKQEALEQAMPELLGIFTTQTIYPTAKLYLGKEGVKYVFEMLLQRIKDKKVKQLYVYSDYQLTEQFPQFFKKWRLQKDKTKAFTQLIVPFNTPMNENYANNDFRETRVMPEEFSFMGSFDICDSLVSFFSFKDNEVYSIVIDSPIVSQMLTKLFKYIWITLK